MKVLTLWGLLLLTSACNLANASDTEIAILPTPSLNSDAERSRIQAERAREEALFLAAEAQCYTRFAVSDCIRQARSHRREMLDKLRRQEVSINDAERKLKALEQFEKIREKSSVQRVEEDSLRRLDAQQAQKEREDNAAQKANEANKVKPVQSRAQPASEVKNTSRSQEDIARDRKQYLDKQKEAEAHRASVLKSIKDKTEEPKKPLPTFP